MTRRTCLRVLLFIAAVTLGLAGAIATEAATNGAADGTYTVTVTLVEACQGSSNCQTLFSGSQAINIAAANAGAVASSLVSGAEITAGTSNTINVTIGSTLQAKGYVNISGQTQYTDGGTDLTAFNNIAGSDQFNQADYATSTFTVPSAQRTQTTGGLTITVGPGLPAPKCRVAFDTSGVIFNDGGNPGLNPPSVTITVN